MNSITTQLLSLRDTRSDDAALCEEIFFEDLAPTFSRVPEALRSQILRMQYDARGRDYAERWPDRIDRIVVCDGVDVGRCLIARRSDAIYAIDLTLRPHARGQGIGEWVVRGLQRDARRQGVPVLMHVAKSNRAAGLWLRLGLEVTGDDGAHLSLAWRP